MSALAKILAREPDPEADEIPGKPILPVPALADSIRVNETVRGSANEKDAKAASPLSSIITSRSGQSISTLTQALDACVAFLAKYMRMDSEHQPHVCALWAVACWVYETFDFCPYLFVRSPERECGKSKLMECLMCLVPQGDRQVYTASISISSLARTIHKHRAIVFLDEIDKFFAHGTDDPIVGILNAGFKRGATYDRYNVQINDNEKFNVWSPKCFGGIGNNLDDTTQTRSLTIRLNKQSRDNPSAIMRSFRVLKETEAIREFLEQWAARAPKELVRIAEAMEFPEEMKDGRKRDICEPLLAVADLAGGEWPERARDALIAITSEATDSSENTQLLKDIRVIFETKNTDQITSHTLLDELVKLEGEGPWAVYWERSIQNNQYNGPAKKVSTMLSEFKIGSHNVTIEGEQKKGYRKSDFFNAWRIYCPVEIERSQSEFKL